MKIIDLLNKISNGEKTPDTIKVGIYKFYKCKKHNVYDDYDYQNEYGEYLIDYLSEYEYLTKYLFNEIEVIDEVEIIEEEKEIEKLPLPSFEEFKNMSAEERYVVTAKEYDVLHQLIDEINKLKSGKDD